jgi:hypothetical protein
MERPLTFAVQIPLWFVPDGSMYVYYEPFFKCEEVSDG